MTKKIQCQLKDDKLIQNIRVRILKAPFVNTEELRRVVVERQRAIVL